MLNNYLSEANEVGYDTDIWDSLSEISAAPLEDVDIPRMEEPSFQQLAAFGETATKSERLRAMDYSRRPHVAESGMDGERSANHLKTTIERPAFLICTKPLHEYVRQRIDTIGFRSVVQFKSPCKFARWVVSQPRNDTSCYVLLSGWREAKPCDTIIVAKRTGLWNTLSFPKLPKPTPESMVAAPWPCTVMAHVVVAEKCERRACHKWLAKTLEDGQERCLKYTVDSFGAAVQRLERILSQ